MESIMKFFNTAGVKPAVTVALGALTAVAAFNGAVGLAVVGGVATGVVATVTAGAWLLDRVSNKPLF